MDELSAQRSVGGKVLVMADEGLEPRVSALEGEMREIRRATVGSFNALREDLVDLRAEMRSGFDEMRSGFDEMRSKFDLTATGQQQIVDILQTLIDRGDR